MPTTQTVALQQAPAGTWDTAFVLCSQADWCELSVETGKLRVCVMPAGSEPTTGHLLVVGDRWASPQISTGEVMVSGDGGASDYVINGRSSG